MKQMILMRTDLNMRKGKMIAQGAHASLGATIAHLEDPRVLEWLDGPFKKVCVRVDSLEQLEETVNLADAHHILTCVITDSGLTEFGGTPTITCAAIGPDDEKVIDHVTGGLKLL